MSIIDHANPKSLKQLLAFLNLHQHAKNQFFLSVHSRDTVYFRDPWDQTGHTHIWPCPTKRFRSTFNYHEFVSTLKKSDFFIDLLWRYRWFKNLTIWLTESILAYISETRVFSNMRFVHKLSKYYKFSW